MVNVAVAGGTSPGLAASIVEGLATRNHSVTVLSRSDKNPYPHLSNVKVVAVDYSSIESLVSALKDVHTVISTIGSPNTIEEVQLNLLKAAKEAGAKRFAPSEFTLHNINTKIDLYKGKIKVWDECLKSGLEVAQFTSGFFMNYLATGIDNSLLMGLRAVKVVIDAENWTANIPGDGNAPVAFTLVQDVGKFVAAAVELEKWDETEYCFYGDQLSYNEIVKMLEEMAGGKKMEVHYTPLESFTDDKKPDEMWAAFAWQIDRELARGSANLGDANLNKLVKDKLEGVTSFRQFAELVLSKKK